MTKLEKKIHRRVECQHQWLPDGEVVLTIYPHKEGAYLGFREPRHRAEYKISLKEAFRQAVMITTAKIAARTRELRKLGIKGATKKARKEFLDKQRD